MFFYIPDHSSLTRSSQNIILSENIATWPSEWNSNSSYKSYQCIAQTLNVPVSTTKTCQDRELLGKVPVQNLAKWSFYGPWSLKKKKRESARWPSVTNCTNKSCMTFFYRRKLTFFLWYGWMRPKLNFVCKWFCIWYEEHYPYRESTKEETLKKNFAKGQDIYN